ncbi:hypothetical protein V9K67_25140 [Paraflavisolibacter sp. H34]|uniref:hypothetical protein n=1 Tax=Huijunlia imazamoxiresistens TaxID=3127457 RepID=UPI0030178DC0
MKLLVRFFLLLCFLFLGNNHLDARERQKEGISCVYRKQHPERLAVLHTRIARKHHVQVARIAPSLRETKAHRRAGKATPTTQEEQDEDEEEEDSLSFQKHARSAAYFTSFFETQAPDDFHAPLKKRFPGHFPYTGTSTSRYIVFRVFRI